MEIYFDDSNPDDKFDPPDDFEAIDFKKLWE
jgi:hypothetical protein